MIPAREKTSLLFWPHQWRGWKNIAMFLEAVPRLRCGEISMFASGSGFDYSAFRRTPEYKSLVVSDYHNPSQRSAGGRLRLRGFAPREEILSAYETSASMPDLTGVSKTRHKANSYVGNYQCATLEAMALGCAVMKMETTVAPHSCIPRDAVCLLPEGAADYADEINRWLSAPQDMEAAAARAFAWLERSCDPYLLFQKHFVA